MNINSYNSNSINTLFSSLNTTNKSSSGFNMFGSVSSNLGVNLADYACIKSGTYYKLMKAYYASTDANTSSVSENNKSTSTSKDTSKKLASILDATDKLNKAANDLLSKGTKSVFNKISKTDSQGNVTASYDTDAIYNKVNAFVDSYNTLVKSASSSNTGNIATAMAGLVNMTDKNASLLKEVGISINSDDYTLKLDKETFIKSDMSAVKSLFNSTGSFGYQVSAKSSMIKYYAESEVAKSNTYSSTGGFTYNYNTGEIFSSET